MKKIPINEASAKQLRYHAEVILGIESIAHSANRGMIQAKIEAAAPGTAEIQIEDEIDSPAQTEAEANSAVAAIEAEAEKAAAVGERASAVHGLSARQAAQHHHDPKIEINIPQTAEAGGKDDVPVSVNGIQWTIQRDKWVTVPYRVFEALNHALQTLYEHSNDDLGRMKVDERSVYSYPFQTRNEPSEAEVAAWRKRTELVELA